MPLADAAHDADRRRALDQRGEQAAARLRAVVERDALAGEQQRAVEVVLGERARAEPLGVGGGRLLARAAALLERDEPGDDGEHEQRGDAGEHGAQAALRARRPPRGSRRGTPARARRARGRGPPTSRARRRAARRGRARRGRARARPTRAPRSPRWWCSRRPSASSSSQPRSRGHSRSSASWATSASLVADGHAAARRRAPHSTSAAPGVRSSSASGTAPAHGGAALADAGQPHQDRPRARPARPGRAAP